MDLDTLVSFGLVLVLVLVGGVFAAAELALVSLRESQLAALERESKRGARAAQLARDPNTFLAAVQIGVTAAGFLSAAYGASTLAPDVAVMLVSIGIADFIAQPIALIGMTMIIVYLSLVLGELVPKRFALQRSAGVSKLVARPLYGFSRLMQPVIWLLSVSTNFVIRILGGNPHAINEEMSGDELRDLVSAHHGLSDDERTIVRDVLGAGDRRVSEVMLHRADVDFLRGDMTLGEAREQVRALPHSRYPVIGESVDDVTTFVHVRDILDADANAADAIIADVARRIVVLPGTNHILPSLTTLRGEGVHLAVVIDEYGGTDGIVTLEDLMEELIGDIVDEYDIPPVIMVDGPLESILRIEGSLNLEDFAELTSVQLEDGPYETVAGFMIARRGRLPEVGDTVLVDRLRLTVSEIVGRRLVTIDVERITLLGG